MPTTEHALRQDALAALLLQDPSEKAQAAHALWQRLGELRTEEALTAALNPDCALNAPDASRLPGRPPLPALVPPAEVPHRSPFTPEGLAALLHAICHIEFNAINLALDAVWRFAGMPPRFYVDWLQVADEEATHFTLLRQVLQSLGRDYGDFSAHDGLWEMCVKTQHDITARMALVPRTLEARGLDATPLIQSRLRQVGSTAAMRAVDVLDIVLRDEIGHVAIGNRWYGWLCQREGLDPIPHYRLLAREYAAPRLRPPFNHEARKAAGFSQAELDYLLSA